MISAWHLLWIIPVAASIGALIGMILNAPTVGTPDDWEDDL